MQKLDTLTRNTKPFSIVVAWFGIAQLISALYPESSLRYTMYLTPFVSIFLYIIMNKNKLDDWYHQNVKTALILYSFAAFISVPGFGQYGSNFLFIRDFLIISGMIITFLPKHEFHYNHILGTFWAIVLAGILGFLKKGIDFSGSFDVLSSQGGMESSYAFTISIFVIFFFIQRKYLMMLIACIFMILFFKRAAMVGVIALFFIEIIISTIKQTENKKIINLGAILTAGIAAFIGWNFISVINYLMDLIPDLGESPETFLLGRYYLSGVITEAYHYTSSIYHYIGHGAGTADRIAADALNIKMFNPHNDHLKIIFDYGYLGMILVYLSLWKMHCGNRLGLYLIMFNSIMFISDNLLIYYFHWFATFLVIGYQAWYEKNKTNASL